MAIVARAGDGAGKRRTFSMSSMESGMAKEKGFGTVRGVSSVGAIEEVLASERSLGARLLGDISRRVRTDFQT